ncbi:MAG TPA: OmcA/MtrC family decaheme c-type cytochrome [Bryobacteraceae bacterium]|nr:OmcA/MtrC family decaheme c-type cytochrome [Bryobacteraceae bacterium]
MDEKDVSFVRPGLVIKITSADVASDGTIKTTFKLTDPKGLPLDRAGVVTPGAISVSFIAATIPSNSSQYTAYTTRVQASPSTGKSATQAAGENNGTFAQVGEGEYTYTFRIKAPATIDRGATHSIGAYGSRNLSEFDLGTQYDDDVFTFVPAGGAITKTRDVIKTATCNGCHDQLAFHGGSRRTMELCVMCHTPQTVDPDTGNTQDLVVLAHKIHMGANLPSVQAGTPYQVIGNGQSVHDYSEIVHPADARNCQSCHGKDTAAQKDAWLKPSRAACGACHDDVDFASGKGHVNLPQVSDNQCSNCHTPEGELEFDASIKGAHTIPRFSKSLPGVVFEIVRVADGTAGKAPTVTFSIKDKSGAPVPASSLSTLRLYYAGPTSDYAGFVMEDALRAPCAGDGTCTYTFSRPLPSDAKGTFAVYIEGYKNATLMEGTTKQITQRDAGMNKVAYFSVDGSKAEPRRAVVDIAKCNACHGNLAFHGDQRNTVEGCVVCHNPNQTDSARRPAAQNPAQTVDFRTMVHRLHRGHAADEEYTVYGFGNVAHDLRFGYPGDLRNCNACHVNDSQQVPLNNDQLAVKTPRGLLDPTPPETAACISCHTSSYAAAHALANTNKIGESCATCHGKNSEFSVDKSHAR